MSTQVADLADAPQQVIDYLDTVAPGEDHSVWTVELQAAT